MIRVWQECQLGVILLSSVIDAVKRAHLNDLNDLFPDVLQRTRHGHREDALVHQLARDACRSVGQVHLDVHAGDAVAVHVGVREAYLAVLSLLLGSRSASSLLLARLQGVR